MRTFARFATLMTVVVLIVSIPVSVVAAKLKIYWSQPVVELEGYPGTVQPASVEFSASVDYSSVDVWVVPELARFIDVVPNTDIAALSDTPVGLQLIVSIPADTEPDVYEGTIHIRDGKRTVAKPLKVEIRVKELSAEVVPEGPTAPSLDRISVDPETGASYLRDEVIVGLSDTFSEADLAQLISSFGGRFLGSIPRISVYQAVFPDVLDAAELDLIVYELANSEITRYAERSWLLETQASPDDNGYGDPDEQLNGWDESSPDGFNAPFEYTKFPSAWDVTTGNPDLRIAVIDTAFESDHLDLAENVANVNAKNSFNTYDFQRAHGTAVAGTIAAKGNNEFALTGAMWDASLVLYSAAILPTTVISTADALDAIVAAINEPLKPRIINLSFKSRGSDTAAFRDVFSLPEAENVLFVVAAGNDTTDDVRNITPARLSLELPNVISVTEIDIDPADRPDEDSLLGLTPVPIPAGAVGPVNVAAPGCVLVLAPGNDTGGRCGSSYAAPMVSGLAGLLLSVDETLSADALKQLIIDGARDEVNGVATGIQVQGQTFYVINAARSLELATGPINPRPTFGRVVLTASGEYWFALSDEGFAPPAAIRTGDPVEVRIEYDLSDAVLSWEGGVGRFYDLRNSDPVFEVTGGGLRWVSTGSQQFDAYVTNAPESDTFGFVATGSSQFPGAISDAARNTLNFGSGQRLPSFLDSTELVLDTSELDFSDILNQPPGVLVQPFGVNIRSLVPEGRWLQSIRIDPASVRIETLDEEVGPTAVYNEALDGDLPQRAFGVDLPIVEFDVGINRVIGSKELNFDAGIWDVDHFRIEMPAGREISRVTYRFSSVQSSSGTIFLQTFPYFEEVGSNGQNYCRLERINVISDPPESVQDSCNLSNGMGFPISAPAEGIYWLENLGASNPGSGSWNYEILFEVE